jgi:hypothetical protein
MPTSKYTDLPPCHVVRIERAEQVRQTSWGGQQLEWDGYGTVLPKEVPPLQVGDVVEMFGAGSAMDAYRINGGPFIMTQWVGYP